MELLCFLLSMTAFLAVLYSVAVTRGTKRQIAEMRDALADIKSGNGNRRILAKTKDTAAPLPMRSTRLSYLMKTGLPPSAGWRRQINGL